MVKKNLNRYQLAAVCAVMAIVLTQSVRPSLAIVLQSDDAFKNLNIRSETQILSNFAASLQAFLKRVAELEARKSVSKAEVAEVTQTADHLKRRVPEVTRNVEAINKKLKAAGLWNDLGTLIRAKIRDSRALNLLTQNGNINDWLERAANEIRTNSDSFFDGSVRRLNAKVIGQQTHPFTNREAQASSFQIVRVGYHPATSRKLGFFACVVLVIFLFSKAINGDVTENDVNQVIDSCG